MTKIFKKGHYEKLVSDESPRPLQVEFYSLETAVSLVQRAWLLDPDFRQAWQDIIAKAFYDECRREDGSIRPDQLHRIANRAADNALNLLYKDGK